MSAQYQTFETLESQLQKAGLPSDPGKIIGRIYQFECKRSGFYHTIFGRIEAIEFCKYSLELYVNSAYFLDLPFRSISYKHIPSRWSISTLEYFVGELKLL